MQTIEVCQSKLVKQPKFEKKTSFFKKKIGWPMLYVFQLKLFK